MSYELINEDDLSYELKHPKGQTFKVAKQALSDAIHAKIKGYAKGGKVENPFEGMSASKEQMMTPAQEPVQTFSANELPAEPYKPQNWFEALEYGAGKLAEPLIAPFTTGVGAEGQKAYQAGLEQRLTQAREMPRQTGGVAAVPGAMPSNVMPQVGLTAPVPVGGEAVPTQVPGGMQPGGLQTGTPQADPMAGRIKSLEGMMTSAAKGESQAKQTLAQDQLKAQEVANQRIAEADQKFQAEFQGLQQQGDALMKAAMDQKIDPNRLWANSSTGAKIAAGIGVILSGLGQGLIGGKNQALEMINGMVDKDIEAQKMQIGKTQSLLSMNFQKTRDLQAATALTKAQIGSWLQGQLSAAAAKAGTPLAKAQEQQALAQIQSYILPMYQAEAQRRTVDSVMRHIGATGDLSYASALPEKQREEVLGRAVPGFGLATTKEAATKANEKIAVVNTAISGLKQLRAFADKGSSFSPTDKAEAETLASMIKGNLRTELIGPGAVSETEWKLLNSIIANPTNVFQLDATAKKSLDTVMNRLNKGMNISLQQYGLKPKTQLDLKPVK